MPSDTAMGRFLNPKLKRPLMGTDWSTCMLCGRRVLLPRQRGNLCGQCFKQKQEKETIDKETQKFLKNMPRWFR